MNNRSECAGIAGLLPAAIIAIRIVLLALVLFLPVASADNQEGGKPAPVVAAPGLGKPALVLSLAPYDQLRSDVLYLARLAGQEDAAAQLDKLIEARTGDRGLAAIDRSKRMGAYGWIGPNGHDSSLVLLVPVADKNAFFNLLEYFNITTGRDGDGVYTATVERAPTPVYFRFANGYAYVTSRDKSVLDEDRLLAPAAVLAEYGCTDAVDADQKSPSLADDAAKVYQANQSCPNLELSLIVNIDRIPTELTDLALGELDLELAKAKETNAPPFETEWQRTFRLATIDEIAGAVKTLLYDGGETCVRLDLDRKAGDAACADVERGGQGRFRDGRGHPGARASQEHHGGAAQKGCGRERRDELRPAGEAARAVRGHD
jgi:hypothetical protein